MTVEVQSADEPPVRSAGTVSLRGGRRPTKQSAFDRGGRLLRRSAARNDTITVVSLRATTKWERSNLARRPSVLPMLLPLLMRGSPGIEALKTD